MSQATNNKEARILVPVKERYITQHQLEDLRHNLGALIDKNIALQNSGLRITPKGEFIFDDFAVEVDESGESGVRNAISASGLSVAESLHENSQIVQSVKNLVSAHLRDPEVPPRYAIWFRRHDPVDVHLLEIADGVFDPGTGALEGIAMQAGSAVPGVRAVVLYLASPSEVKKAILDNSTHPAVQSMIHRNCDILVPLKNGWTALEHEFPELRGKSL